MNYKKINGIKILGLSLLLISSQSYAGLAKSLGVSENLHKNKINTNKYRGLTNYNGELNMKKLLVETNELKCDSENSKKYFSELDSYNSNIEGEKLFIGNFKTLKETKNISYCSVNIKTNYDTFKENFWIIKTENGEIRYEHKRNSEIDCQEEIVLEKLKDIAKERKLELTEFGGATRSNFEFYKGETHCTIAYKTIDIEEVENLSYTLSYNEDYNIVVKTEDSYPFDDNEE